MSLVDETPSITTDVLITQAFSGVTNGRLSSLVAKMDKGNTIQISLYPDLGNLACLEDAYNKKYGCPTLNHKTLSSNSEFERAAKELKEKHGLHVIDANKPSDDAKIILTLEKR